MKYIAITALLISIGLTACSSDDNGEVQPQDVPGITTRTMYVDVTENPLTDNTANGARETVSTRTAAPTTTSTLSSFSMNYMDSKYDFTKTAGQWSTASWPGGGVGNDDKLDFYAYNGGTYSYNSGAPYATFSVDEDAFNQHDFLVAEHKQISYNDAKGHVSLTFDHACAAVFFTVQITNTLRTNLGHDLTVNSIVLRNVYKSGTYNYGTKSWSDVSTVANYTLTNAAITVTPTPQDLPSKYLFMIPQVRPADGGIYLEVNYTTSSAKSVSIPLDVNWESGQLYTINIKLGTSAIQP